MRAITDSFMNLIGCGKYTDEELKQILEIILSEDTSQQLETARKILFKDGAAE